MTSWEDGLRPQQRKVAGAAPGTWVVLAGPGTGKTFVLVRRIQFLLEERAVSPESIVAITFTRAAAAEMRGRLNDRLGADTARRIRVSTLHSFALREVLRTGAKGLPSPVRVADDWEQRWIVEEELAALLGRPVLPTIGAMRRLADDWDSLAADDSGWEAGHPDPAFLTAWRKHRAVYGYTLRSELVYQLLCELRSNPDLVATDAQLLVVDEYQDLNRCDIETVRLTSRRASSDVFACGDDDQSIYSFRHGHPAGIRAFDSEYGCEQLHMTECLRCGPSVVELASWLIKQDPERADKGLVSVTDWPSEMDLVRFKNEADEAKQVAALCRRFVDCGAAADEILILLKNDAKGRVSAPIVAALESEGLRAFLPRGGAGDDAEFQRLKEYVSLLAALDEGESNDLSIRALLELEENGVGATTHKRALGYALEQGIRYREALIQLQSEETNVFPRSRVIANAFEATMNRAYDLVEVDGDDLESWLQRLDVGLELSADCAARLRAHVDRSLVDSGAPIGRIAGWVLGAIVALDDDQLATVPGHVTVTTMHGAKGLSADVVFVLQAENEIIPGAAFGADLSEARRLLYVSLTRAKRHLIIGACDRRRGGQQFVGKTKSLNREVSSFLVDYGMTATRADDVSCSCVF